MKHAVQCKFVGMVTGVPTLYLKIPGSSPDIPWVWSKKDRSPETPRTTVKIKLVDTEMCDTMENRLRERLLREA